MPADSSWEPAYLRLSLEELRCRARAAKARLAACDLCPRRCGVDRLAGERGYCRSTARLQVASWHRHMGEEPAISGQRGSGTIFFSNCTARCIYCQNYPISQLGTGNAISTAELASAMLSLQREGCHNVNLVTPTHYVPQILEALVLGVQKGLRIPLVYNTSGYETVDTLRLLDGVVDVYLPDAKYADEAVARELSGFDAYVRHNRAALREMQRQVGSTLMIDEAGVARRGLIVRHLVLPEGLSQTAEVLTWLAEVLDTDIHLSLMSQYFPAYEAVEHPRLGRRLRPSEYERALAHCERLGLEQGWRQVAAGPEGRGV